MLHSEHLKMTYLVFECLLMNNRGRESASGAHWGAKVTQRERVGRMEEEGMTTWQATQHVQHGGTMSECGEGKVRQGRE